MAAKPLTATEVATPAQGGYWTSRSLGPVANADGGTAVGPLALTFR
ncbi:hypothetical protein SAMN06265355_12726 [Actinomadura mexicana]|uniref:Uncharacterized protein n=1 Tax=Actinomadura mexicana TaxID=134959 RepID=A0A239GYN6_9ACTN|nr:hypothetical protein SAMN06265355_12726 [Actinomadura mexicana]